MLVRGDRVAAAPAGDRADDGVPVNVNDVVPKPVEAPTHRIHDDVVGPGGAEGHPLDDVIVRVLGRDRGSGEGQKGACGDR